LLPCEDTVDEDQLSFLLGERPDDMLEDPVMEAGESQLEFLERCIDFWKTAYKRERDRIPELRELGCLKLPCDEVPEEKEVKKASIWGNIRGKRRLEELEEEETVKEADRAKKKKRLEEEAPVKSLLIELHFLDDDKANLRLDCLQNFVTRNKKVFDFVRPNNKLLRYCKRDVIIDITRRWMIEGQFDPDSEPQQDDPRSLETLVPLLTPNPTPEDDAGPALAPTPADGALAAS